MKDLDKNLPNDNLEQFFKQELEKFDGEPSGDMWNRIEGVIPPKPLPWWKANIKWLGSAMSVVVVIGVLSLVLMRQQSQEVILTAELDKAQEQIEELQGKVTTLEERQPMSQEGQEVITNVEQSENIVSAEDNTDNVTASQERKNGKLTTPSITTNKVQPVKTVENTIKNKTNNTPTKSINNTDLIIPTEPIILNPNSSNKDKALDLKTTTESEKVKLITSKPIATKTQEVKYVKDLAFLQKPFTNLLFNYEKALPLLPTIDPISVPKESNGLIVGAYISPIWSKSTFGKRHRPQNPAPLPLDQIREQSLVGISSGVKIGYGLSDKLQVFGGIAYDRSQNNMEIRKRIPYPKDGETMNNGNTENNLGVQATTSVGDVAMTVTVQTSTQNNISDGEILNFTANTIHTLQTLQIPLYLQYQLLDNNKFSLGIKGGMTIGSFLKHEVTVTNYRFDRNNVLVLNPPNINTPPPPNKRISTALTTGLALGYQVNQQVGISIEPTYLATLANRNRRDRLGSVRASTFGIQVGMNYAF